MAPNFGIAIGIPAPIQQLIQRGLLEREFHDDLFPALLFRGEAQWEEWEENTGTQIFMTRPGLLAPVTTPLVAGVDPLPQTLTYEQWSCTINRYGATIDTHMPTSTVSIADEFLRNIHQLGLQAGQSLNRIPRNALYQAYLSGQTASILATNSTDTTLRVASCNGFTTVVNTSSASGVRPATVSAQTPLAIQLINGSTAINLSVIGYILDNSSDINGPGTLLLSGQIGAAVATRSAVLSTVRPKIIRAGGGNTVDAITQSDLFTLQDAINATDYLRRNNVLPYEDGYFHGHIPNDSNTQWFQDPSFQRLTTAMPDASYHQQGFVSEMAGIKFFLNNECPDYTNSGNRTLTGVNAMYSQDIGAETTNESQVNIGRVIVTGRGALYEKSLDEAKYVSEAGVTGKIGDFDVVNAGIKVQTDNIRLTIRAPLDRLQDVVSTTWSCSTGFAVPTDLSSGLPSLFKRAVVIEASLSQ